MIKIYIVFSLLVLYSCGHGKYGSRDYSTGDTDSFNLQVNDLVDNEALELSSQTNDFTDSLIREFTREMNSLVIDSTSMLVENKNEVKRIDSTKVIGTTTMIDSVKVNVTTIDSITIINHVVDSSAVLNPNNSDEVKPNPEIKVVNVIVPIPSGNEEDTLTNEMDLKQDSVSNMLIIDSAAVATTISDTSGIKVEKLPVDSISQLKPIKPVISDVNVTSNDSLLQRKMQQLEDVVGNQTLLLEKLLKYQEDRQESELKPLEKIDSIKVPVKETKLVKTQVVNFYFSSGSTIPEIEGKELDSILTVLKSNKGLKVLLSGMTDQSGSKTLNYELSIKRTEKVKELLISKGVEPTRIFVQYLGESNSTSDVNPNERRVECKVIE